MNVALRLHRMTREQFFAWAEAREERYEFDGFQPVAMTGRTVNHSRITINLPTTLRHRLRGSACAPFGPDAGVGTVNDAVRYPDAVVSCSKTPGEARLAVAPVAVFEVLSPTSGRVDRIDKLREYAAVETILRYVILEYTSAAAAVFEREHGSQPFTATGLTSEDTLRMPELGIEIPLAELYEDIELPQADAATA